MFFGDLFPPPLIHLSDLLTILVGCGWLDFTTFECVFPYIDLQGTDGSKIVMVSLGSNGGETYFADANPILSVGC
jgi:hypothetical protein